MILYLLTHKQADVNMPDFSGFTPLHHLSMAAKFYAYGNYTKEQMQ